MAELTYKKSNNGYNQGSTLFCFVLDGGYDTVGDGKARVWADCYLYCSWGTSSTPFYGYSSQRGGWINGECLFWGEFAESGGSSWPSGAGSWSGNSRTIGGTAYKQRTHVFSISKTITYDYGTTPQIPVRMTYTPQWTGGYAPSSSIDITGYVTLPEQAKPTCTITYAANGGSSTPSTQTKTNGVAINLAAAISRSNSSQNGYTITYNANGGNTPSTTSQTQKNTIKYTFSSWKSSLDGKTYSAGASYNVDGDTTMTAQWSSSTTKGTLTSPTCTRNNGTSTRTVTFNANGGSCSTSSLNSTATVTYSLNGWYTAASGGTKRVNGNTSYTPSATETLYAQWGSSTGSYSAITLPTATRTGYIFKGWSTSSTATSGSTGSYTPTGNVTLYAVWQEDTRGNIYVKQNGSWVLVSSKYKWANR